MISPAPSASSGTKSSARAADTRGGRGGREGDSGERFFALESTDGRTLYYVKGLVGGQALYARAVGGGEERALASRADGRPGGELRFFDLAAGRSRVHGLTVSPDRRTIPYTARKPPDDDLMLIENFR